MSKAPLVDQVVAQDWSGAMGDKWLANLARFEGMIAPIGEALMTRAAFTEGERVIDVGCGAGGTTVEIARRVGTSGAAFGLDISQALIDAASRRARGANVSNVQFHCADAATFHLDGPGFDHLFSRFGLMFFAEPAAAFTNLHGLLRRGARADFSVWAPARENAWVAQLTAILAQHIELPAPVPHAPGPFAFDDLAYLHAIMDRAGFKSVQVDVWQGDQMVGGARASPPDAADFVLRVMSFGEMLEETNPAARDRVRERLIELFARHQTSAGIAMAAKAFLVTAYA
jgi:SAM-dependent methyltransferase